MSIINAILYSLDLRAYLLLFLCLLVSYTYIVWKRVSKFPPGPTGIPILGYVPFIDQSLHFWRLSQELAKRYNSDITSMNIFGTTMVFLTSRDAAKEAFQKRHDMAERPEHNFIKAINAPHEGLIMSCGQLWKEHKKFALLMLRDFGMGKIAAQRIIQDEAVVMCQHFREIGRDTDCDPRMLINPAVSNIICATALGKRFSYYDPQFVKLIEAINFILSMTTSAYGRIINSNMSWLAPILYHDAKRDIRKNYDFMCEFISQHIDEHKKVFDGSVNDVIDGYLLEQSQRNETSSNHSFTDEQLSHVIFDLLFAGSETTTTTLRWTLLYLLKYPELQERIYREISAVVEHDRIPDMSDKDYTPYTEAFLLEIQRLNTVAPLAAPHTNEQDVQLMGYTIPANSAIFSNLGAIHRDPRLFAYPDTFRPERFLEGDKIIDADKLEQFGIGRRSCAGEALARMEIYIFFTSLVNQFKFVPINDEPINVDCGLDSIVLMPAPYLFRAVPRQ